MSLPDRPRVTIAGAGSIGCYVGGCLARAGRDVTLLTRPALADAIARHGLRVSELDGADDTLAPSALKVTTDAASALAQADIVLVTVKSGATPEMADAIGRHAPPGAVVVSLQNGIGNADALRARLDATHRVVAGMVPFNVVQTREGAAPRFHRATSGTIGIAQGVPGLRRTLDVPGAPVAEHPDMEGVLWAKLLLNLNNALNALSGLPLAGELADRRWRVLLAAQIAEALAVLRAADVRLARVEAVPPRAIPFILRLPDVIFRVVASRMLAIDPAARSSMWEDLERRRLTEIDYLQGAILALAAEAGVAAPVTGRIAGLVKDAERAGRGSPGLRPEEVAGDE
jgi:2-dehydropantoate 2-reductase